MDDVIDPARYPAPADRRPPHAGDQARPATRPRSTGTFRCRASVRGAELCSARRDRPDTQMWAELQLRPYLALAQPRYGSLACPDAPACIPSRRPRFFGAASRPSLLAAQAAGGSELGRPASRRDWLVAGAARRGHGVSRSLSRHRAGRRPSLARARPFLLAGQPGLAPARPRRRSARRRSTSTSPPPRSISPSASAPIPRSVFRALVEMESRADRRSKSRAGRRGARRRSVCARSRCCRDYVSETRHQPGELLPRGRSHRHRVGPGGGRGVVCGAGQRPRARLVLPILPAALREDAIYRSGWRSRSGLDPARPCAPRLPRARRGVRSASPRLPTRRRAVRTAVACSPPGAGHRPGAPEVPDPPAYGICSRRSRRIPRGHRGSPRALPQRCPLQPAPLLPRILTQLGARPRDACGR